jgi:hypothetical protein
MKRRILLRIILNNQLEHLHLLIFLSKWKNKTIKEGARYSVPSNFFFLTG